MLIITIIILAIIMVFVIACLFIALIEWWFYEPIDDYVYNNAKFRRKLIKFIKKFKPEK
jgi:hypothetical protein